MSQPDNETRTHHNFTLFTDLTRLIPAIRLENRVLANAYRDLGERFYDFPLQVRETEFEGQDDLLAQYTLTPQAFNGGTSLHYRINLVFTLLDSMETLLAQGQPDHLWDEEATSDWLDEQQQRLDIGVSALMDTVQMYTDLRPAMTNMEAAERALDGPAVECRTRRTMDTPAERRQRLLEREIWTAQLPASFFGMTMLDWRVARTALGTRMDR